MQSYTRHCCGCCCSREASVVLISTMKTLIKKWESRVRERKLWVGKFRTKKPNFNCDRALSANIHTCSSHSAHVGEKTALENENQFLHRERLQTLMLLLLLLRPTCNTHFYSHLNPTIEFISCNWIALCLLFQSLMKFFLLCVCMCTQCHCYADKYVGKQ